MPAAWPQTSSFMARSSLMCFCAMDTLVRSMYAMVYIKRATGMMRIQR